jgi:hypothetical protein
MATWSQEYPILSVGSSVRGNLIWLKNPHPLEDSLNAPTRSPLTAELVNDISIPMDKRVQQLEFSCRVGPCKPVYYDLHVVHWFDAFTSFSAIMIASRTWSCSVDSNKWILHTPLHIESTGIVLLLHEFEVQSDISLSQRASQVFICGLWCQWASRNTSAPAYIPWSV